MSEITVAEQLWAGITTQPQIKATLDALWEKSIELSITKTLDIVATSEKLQSTNWSAVVAQAAAKADAEQPA